MICKECESKGEKSVIFEGGTMTTLAFCPPYYEDGVRHHHDGNWCSDEFSCSNGHHWCSEKYQKPCPAEGCEWPNK
jgi:hypothetical protein